MHWLGIVVAIVVIVGGIITIVNYFQSQADILYSVIEYPEEISTTSNCQIFVKNVGESTGPYRLTVTSNNFILSDADPTPQYDRDNELIFKEYALMSAEYKYFTFTISINENLPEIASYTIRLDRYTWLRKPLGETFNYVFDGSKYVLEEAIS